jgi:hypothetical protein
MSSLIDITYKMIEHAETNRENLKQLNLINLDELSHDEFLEYSNVIEELETSISKIDYLLKMTETIVLPENKRRLNKR